MHIKNNKFFLSFPSYTLKKNIHNELSMTGKIYTPIDNTIHFDSTSATLANDSSHTSPSSLQHSLISYELNHYHQMTTHSLLPILPQMVNEFHYL